MSQKACSLQGGYLLTCGNKYHFQVQVELVNLDDQTLVYVLSPILSSAHTAGTAFQTPATSWQCRHVVTNPQWSRESSHAPPASSHCSS
jgi:hypothetical protein